MNTTKKRRLFGTDGIRGIANEYPMTADSALKIGQAAAAYFLSRHPKKPWKHGFSRPRIIIGKDTRISNYMLEQAISSGVCSMGADAFLLGPIPTPGISFLVRSMRADAGIVISASHNSYEYSGIKLFASNGDKLPDDVELEIEELIFGERELPPLPKGTEIGKAKRIEDALGRYIVSTKACFGSELSLEGMRVVVDCANGAAYKFAPIVFQELGAEVIATGVQPNGSNVNERCGALYPEKARQMVLEYRADMGVALDGDADRVVLIDENGETLDGDEILALNALEMKRTGQLKRNAVVITAMSNLGLRTLLDENKIEYREVPVGDRYILGALRKESLSLGGEPSGHIIFGDVGSTGDGVLTALKTIEMVCRTGKPLSQLKKVFTKFPQVLENITVREKRPLESMPELQKRIASIAETMGSEGRVLVRYSGTEPLVRVMVEGRSLDVIQSYAEEIAAVFRGLDS